MQQDASTAKGITTAAVIVCLSVGGYWWWTHQRPRPIATRENHLDAKQRPIESPPLLTNGHGEEDHERSPTTDRQPKAALDLSRTSWQNPFGAVYWKSAGWSFGEKSMQSAPSGQTQATFRRPYRRLRLDVDLQLLSPTGSFAVRLQTAETETTTTVALEKERIVVTAETGARPGIVVKQRQVDLGLAPNRRGRLGLAATGNRLIVVWNHWRVLTCSQPAEQSGHPVTLTLSTEDGAFRVSRLRIEGE